MATPIDSSNPGKRRRRLALLLALLLSATALGIGSSVLYFQHKSKAGAASAKRPVQGNEGIASGATSNGPASIETPADSGTNAPTAQSAPIAPPRQHGPVANNTKKHGADSFADNAMKDKPPAVGSDDLPGPADNIKPTDNVASNDPLQNLPPADAGPAAPDAGPGTTVIPGFSPTLETVGTDGKSQSSNITSAVPEPSTWLMMLAGLGGLFAVRRRRD